MQSYSTLLAKVSQNLAKGLNLETCTVELHIFILLDDII
jgi:hypothetical protein